MTKAIEFNKASKEAGDGEDAKQRRTAAPTAKVSEPEATGRRTAAPPKYVILDK